MPIVFTTSNSPLRDFQTQWDAQIILPFLINYYYCNNSVFSPFNVISFKCNMRKKTFHWEGFKCGFVGILTGY